MIKEAYYAKSNLPEQYQGNPLIECLPEIQEGTAILAALTEAPRVNLRTSRTLPIHIRMHDIALLKEMFIPRNEWVTFENDLGILLRQGLKRRNPFYPETQRNLFHLQTELKTTMLLQRTFNDPFAGSIFLPALSGSGKTRGIRSILSMYPKTIEHTNYNGTPFRQKQIVWLSVEAPVNGSIRGFLSALFHELDLALEKHGDDRYAVQYQSDRISWDILIQKFSQAAASHYLGVLHIDDLQRLLEANSDQRERIFGFIIQLANVAKIPLVLSGTYKMVKLLGRSFEAARRSTEAGFIYLPHAPNHTDGFFRNLVNGLFKFQWTEYPLVLDERVFKAIHSWSLGLPFLVVGIYHYGQKIALRSGSRDFKLEHMKAAYDGPYQLLRPAINALRRGGPAALIRYEDLLPPREQLEKVLLEFDNSEKKAMLDDIVQKLINEQF